MVDYYLVRLNCPSFSFLFTRLYNLLKAVGRKFPRVGLFVEKTYPYRSVLLFLFPLVYRLIGIAQSLIMSGEGEVKSSELETGLSLSKDHKALQVTSSSTLYKVWDICCTLKGKDNGRIGFDSLRQSRLGSLVAMIGLSTLMLTKCAFTRLTSSVVFVFPSIPS